MLKVNIIEQKKKSQWFDYNGAKFKIRNIGNQEYQVELSYLNSDREKQRDKINELSKTQFDFIAEACAKYLLEDWRGISFDGKTEADFSFENASKLLRNGDLGTKIWAFIIEKATEIENNLYAEQAELLGKSES